MIFLVTSYYSAYSNLSNTKKMDMNEPCQLFGCSLQMSDRGCISAWGHGRWSNMKSTSHLCFRSSKNSVPRPVETTLTRDLSTCTMYTGLPSVKSDQSSAFNSSAGQLVFYCHALFISTWRINSALLTTAWGPSESRREYVVLELCFFMGRKKADSP